MYPQIFAVVFGVGCVGIISFCIHFDQKRRADPAYKQKIRNRRRTAARLSGKSQSVPQMSVAQKLSKTPAPSFEGYPEEKITELVYAVLSSENPRQILQFIYCSMPRSVFDDVTKRALPFWNAKYGH